MPKIQALQKHRLRAAIRFIKQAPLQRVLQFQGSVNDAMERLEMRPDSGKAVSGLPEGSDHFNLMDAAVWARGIQPEHKGAKRQLASIAATIEKRIAL